MLVQNRTKVFQRTGVSSGIISPFIGFACILTAIAMYPSFSWTNNALSDLGVIPGITGFIFNFGLFASGLLAFNFAVFGLYNYLGKSWAGKIGAVVFASGALALIAIGVFNESFLPTHYLVSVAFFVLMPISMLIITCSFLLTHQVKLAIYTVSAGIAAALPWIVQFTINYAPNVAIPEFISGLVISVWTITFSYRILKETH